jgi:two-component system chemotaxis response regulator CheB
MLLAPVGPADPELGPSIDVTFASAARSEGRGVVAVLMTGMGRDGAVGLHELERVGATTIAQEPSTCVVDSMPVAAITSGAVKHVLSPKEIARWVAHRCGGS